MIWFFLSGGIIAAAAWRLRALRILRRRLNDICIDAKDGEKVDAGKVAGKIDAPILILSAIAAAFWAGALAAFLRGFSAFGLTLLGLGILALKLGPRRRSVAAARRLQRELGFNLPIVIERIVLAAQAGLDAQSCVAVAAGGGETGIPAPRDPASRLLLKVSELSNSGSLFEDALRSVAAESRSPHVRHAFAQLAIVHRNGGETAAALRELGDSVQGLYELSVEEEIARMPVKATMPLVLAFAGLLIGFVTIPLIQLSKLSRHSSPSGIEMKYDN